MRYVFRRTLPSRAVWLSGALLAAGMVQALAYSGDQERFCTGDAFRLCASEIPDVDRVTACMERKKAQLSPDCRAVFDESSSPGAKRGQAARQAPPRDNSMRQPVKRQTPND